MERCGIIWPGSEWELRDDTGCIKPESHNDDHVCLKISESGNGASAYTWEDDYTCTCGCWDEIEDSDCVCRVYKEICSFPSASILSDDREPEKWTDYQREIRSLQAHITYYHVMEVRKLDFVFKHLDFDTVYRILQPLGYEVDCMGKFARISW